MALPTLQPYYLTRRSKAGAAERLIVQRRTHESDTKQRWSEHSKYFHNSDVRSSKQEAWTSSKSFQDRLVVTLHKFLVYIHICLLGVQLLISAFSSISGQFLELHIRTEQFSTIWLHIRTI